MNTFAKTLLAGAMAVLASSPALAGGKHVKVTPIDVVSTAQLNLNAVYSDMLINGDWLGSLRATSAAIGNNASLETHGSGIFYSDQFQAFDVGATLHGFVNGVAGDAALQAVAICNNYALDNKGSSYTFVRNLQRCITIDPFAITDVTLSNVGGDATVSAVAIANNATLATDANEIGIQSYQVNGALTYARVSTDISNVAGDVTVTAAAIGNNLSITVGDE
jgi:hypothetical protein